MNSRYYILRYLFLTIFSFFLLINAEAYSIDDVPFGLWKTDIDETDKEFFLDVSMNPYEITYKDKNGGYIVFPFSVDEEHGLVLKKPTSKNIELNEMDGALYEQIRYYQKNSNLDSDTLCYIEFFNSNKIMRLYLDDYSTLKFVERDKEDTNVIAEEVQPSAHTTETAANVNTNTEEPNSDSNSNTLSSSYKKQKTSSTKSISNRLPSWLSGKLGIYLIIINLAAFILYWLDKRKAQKGEWRIRETTLIGIALIGGTIGAFLGMYVWNHKTKKWYFKFCLTLILILQIICGWLYSNRELFETNNTIYENKPASIQQENTTSF